MKKVCTMLFLLCLGYCFSSNGQIILEKTKEFKEIHFPEIRRINDSVFEVRFLVRLQPGWRIYCQQQKDERFPRNHMSYFDLKPDNGSRYLLGNSTEERGIKREGKEKREKSIKGKDTVTAQYYKDSVLFVRRFMAAKEERGIPFRPGISGIMRYIYGKGDGERKEISYSFGTSFRSGK